MSAQRGMTITYITRDSNQDKAILIDRAPGPGCWWARVDGRLATVKVAERTREKSRRWYEVD